MEIGQPALANPTGLATGPQREKVLGALAIGRGPVTIPSQMEEKNVMANQQMYRIVNFESVK